MSKVMRESSPSPYARETIELEQLATGAANKLANIRDLLTATLAAAIEAGRQTEMQSVVAIAPEVAGAGLSKTGND